MPLITFLTLLPFLSFALIFAKKEEGEVCQKYAYRISQISAIIFFAIIFGVMRDLPNMNLEILKFNSHISFALSVAKQDLAPLFLLAFTWLIFSFYSPAFLSLESQEIAESDPDFVKLLPIFVGFLNIIIISKNLPTMFFGYSFLAIIAIFTFQEFILTNSSKKSVLFSQILIAELSVFLIFILFIINFSYNSNFTENGLAISASRIITFVIFVAFFFAILPSIILPIFSLINRDIISASLKNHLFLIMFLAFAKLLIFIKLAVKIMGIGLFSTFINKYFVLLIEIIFAFSIIFNLICLLFSRNFAKTFIFLFFNQLSFAFLSIFIALFADKAIFMQIFINFTLLIMLSFIMLQNLMAYFKNAQSKDFDGVFFSLKITISLLIFVLLNFSSILPPFLTQNVNLLQISYQNGLFISILTIFINSFGLFLFSYKLLFASFLQNGVTYYEDDIEFAKKIDFSSQLSLTAVLICVTIIIIIFN